MARKNSVGFKQYNEFVFKQYKLEIVLSSMFVIISYKHKLLEKMICHAFGNILETNKC